MYSDKPKRLKSIAYSSHFATVVDGITEDIINHNVPTSSKLYVYWYRKISSIERYLNCDIFHYPSPLSAHPFKNNEDATLKRIAKLEETAKFTLLKLWQKLCKFLENHIQDNFCSYFDSNYQNKDISIKESQQSPKTMALRQALNLLIIVNRYEFDLIHCFPSKSIKKKISYINNNDNTLNEYHKYVFQYILEKYKKKSKNIFSANKKDDDNIDDYTIHLSFLSIKKQKEIMAQYVNTLNRTLELALNIVSQLDPYLNAEKYKDKILLEELHNEKIKQVSITNNKIELDKTINNMQEFITSNMKNMQETREADLMILNIFCTSILVLGFFQLPIFSAKLFELICNITSEMSSNILRKNIMKTKIEYKHHDKFSMLAKKPVLENDISLKLPRWCNPSIDIDDNNFSKDNNNINDINWQENAFNEMKRCMIQARSVKYD